MTTDFAKSAQKKRKKKMKPNKKDIRLLLIHTNEPIVLPKELAQMVCEILTDYANEGSLNLCCGEIYESKKKVVKRANAKIKNNRR